MQRFCWGNLLLLKWHFAPYSNESNKSGYLSRLPRGRGSGSGRRALPLPPSAAAVAAAAGTLRAQNAHDFNNRRRGSKRREGERAARGGGATADTGWEAGMPSRSAIGGEG